MQNELTGPWIDDDDVFNFRVIAKHRDQLEPDAIVEKLKRANRSLNNFLGAWGQRKIGQGHDLYVHHIPAANMTPAARALFLHIYLDIVHIAVLLGDNEPFLRVKEEDRVLLSLILKELVAHNLIVVTQAGQQFYVKDFMAGGSLLMININYAK